MSMQTQPQMQQQPVNVYPNTMTKQHHSDGSFGTVFIVLAVIVVISGIACCLGRLCNKGAHKPKPKCPKPRQNLENNRPRERDVEFGFDPKRFPTPKPPSNGEPREFRPHENGSFKGETRVAAEDEQLKQGP